MCIRDSFATASALHKWLGAFDLDRHNSISGPPQTVSNGAKLAPFNFADVLTKLLSTTVALET
eukprot:4329419-Amphidinium_carterae.3